jgi:6-pyruvoyltetrahydropterin/6-carboxytetrahydropterin synthase
MHGHSFKVEIIVEGTLDPVKGYLVDYGDLKRALSPLHDALDHRCLNEIEGLSNPTSEMLAAWIWQRLKPTLPMLSEVVVCETCTSRCEFRGEARST